jgi:hypothetical protein
MKEKMEKSKKDAFVDVECNNRYYININIVLPKVIDQ